ncbi:hypothetical protein ILYODFUR_011210 [Ilyodon furcidens]|uniref:Uncharacterized protein n=1 Tax=Ilyodon furcidens TaxID=33524 RepID=A0ABV0VD32_9TELE
MGSSSSRCLSELKLLQVFNSQYDGSVWELSSVLPTCFSCLVINKHCSVGFLFLMCFKKNGLHFSAGISMELSWFLLNCRQNVRIELVAERTGELLYILIWNGLVSVLITYAIDLYFINNGGPYSSCVTVVFCGLVKVDGVRSHQSVFN